MSPSLFSDNLSLEEIQKILAVKTIAIEKSANPNFTEDKFEDFRRNHPYFMALQIITDEQTRVNLLKTVFDKQNNNAAMTTCEQNNTNNTSRLTSVRRKSPFESTDTDGIEMQPR